MERERDEGKEEWRGKRDRELDGGMEPPEHAGGFWVKLWFPVLPTGGAYTPSIRKWVFAVQGWEEGGG